MNFTDLTNRQQLAVATSLIASNGIQLGPCGLRRRMREARVEVGMDGDTLLWCLAVKTPHVALGLPREYVEKGWTYCAGDRDGFTAANRELMATLPPGFTVSVVRADNIRGMRFTQKQGFVPKWTVRSPWSDGDLVIHVWES